MKATILKLPILFLLLSITVTGSCGPDARDNSAEESVDGPRLRVLGYLFAHGNWWERLQEVDLDAITDLNLAFLNPDASGDFVRSPDLVKLVQRAHAHDVQVFFSIGGGSPPAHLEQLLQTRESRAKLVTGIVSLINEYGFDGVDIDLENDLINEHYALFVAEVATAVKPLGKLVTAALASWNGDKISDETLAHYDFINIMSYDATGPWNPERPGPHAPYSMAVDDFEYYHQRRGIAAGKLFVGLPFYGYGFGDGAPESLFYRDIVHQWPGSETADEVALDAGGKIYYNGIPTIERKTQFALEQSAGGVMIWHLLHDTDDERSLLRAINNIIKQQQKQP